SIHVGRRRKCQPDAVVRNPRADALPRLRQPPMLNVAFAELSTGRTQEMASRLFGFCMSQGHSVLKLVAKTVGPACLIESRARPNAAGERLVQEPAIEHDVHRT